MASRIISTSPEEFEIQFKDVFDAFHGLTPSRSLFSYQLTFANRFVTVHWYDVLQGADFDKNKAIKELKREYILATEYKLPASLLAKRKRSTKLPLHLDPVEDSDQDPAQLTQSPASISRYDPLETIVVDVPNTLQPDPGSDGFVDIDDSDEDIFRPSKKRNVKGTKALQSPFSPKPRSIKNPNLIWSSKFLGIRNKRRSSTSEDTDEEGSTPSPSRYVLYPKSLPIHFFQVFQVLIDHNVLDLSEVRKVLNRLSQKTRQTLKIIRL